MVASSVWSGRVCAHACGQMPDRHEQGQAERTCERGLSHGQVRLRGADHRSMKMGAEIKRRVSASSSVTLAKIVRVARRDPPSNRRRKRRVAAGLAGHDGATRTDHAPTFVTRARRVRCSTATSRTVRAGAVDRRAHQPLVVRRELDGRIGVVRVEGGHPLQAREQVVARQLRQPDPRPLGSAPPVGVMVVLFRLGRNVPPAVQRGMYPTSSRWFSSRAERVSTVISLTRRSARASYAKSFQLLRPMHVLVHARGG